MPTSTTSPASVTTCNIDPAHSAAEFKVRHMMISNVKGTIKGIKGTLNEHATDSTFSSIEATAEVSTINTGETERDTHLKSDDFFDVEKYPDHDF